MSAHFGNLRLRVPRLHVHSPFVEWRRVKDPTYLALVTTAVTLTLAVAAVAAREMPAFLEAQSTAVHSLQERVELPREWRYSPKNVEFEHMYGANVRAPSVEHMYARPRPQRF